MINFFRMLNTTSQITIGLMVFAILSPETRAAEKVFEDREEKALSVLFEKFLMENPEVILRSIKKMEEREKKQAALASKNILKTKRDMVENDPTSFEGGNLNGDVTIVEFFDYQCGFCKRSHVNIQRIVNEDGNIRHVYKEFPILGPMSLYAARAAIASKIQGKYFVFHDALMRTKGKLDKNIILKIAKSVGIKSKKLLLDIKSQEGETMNYLKNVSLLAQQLQINGTPSFIIGDNILRGAPDEETVRHLLAKIRATKN